MIPDTGHYQYVCSWFPGWLVSRPPATAAGRLAEICANARVVWPGENEAFVWESLAWENSEDLHLDAIVSAIKAIHMEHEGRPTEIGVDEAVADALASICTEDEARVLFRTVWAEWKGTLK